MNHKSRVVLIAIDVALAAAGTLARGPQAPTFDSVVAQLESADPAVRRGALRALGESGYPEAIGPISALLRDPLDDIQIEAVNTLVRFFVAEPLRTRRYIGIVEIRNTNLAEAAFDLGPYHVIPHLVPPALPANLASAMADESARTRVQAVYALGVMAHPSVDGRTAQALIRLLKDPGADIRRAAARVAGRLRVQQAGEALIEAMNDRDERVRSAAMRAVGEVREWRALQALTDLFTYYERGPLAEAALDGLARIAHASSQDLFRKKLGDSSPLIRRYAVEGLARSGNRAAATAAATELEGEQDEGVRVAVAFAAAASRGAGAERLTAALAGDERQDQAMDYL
ncbi:MAG: HEAT repeat domain-containing protein, partial [Vicinamibacteraceae bacterium]